MNLSNLKQSEEIISLKEREKIAKEAVMEIGARKLKVVDIEKAEKIMMEFRKKAGLTPEIVLHPENKNVKDNNQDKQRIDENSFLTWEKDIEFGVYYGIYTRDDKFGNALWEKIYIKENLFLNLKNASDRKLWTVLRMSTEIKGTPYQASLNDSPKWVVYDEAKEAMKKQARAKEMEEAFAIYHKLQGKELVKFARVLGFSIKDTDTPEIIKGNIFDIVQMNPTVLTNAWYNKDRGFIEILESALDSAVIVNDPERGYVMDGQMIGYDKNDAVAKMKEEKDLVNIVLQRLKERDYAMEAFLKAHDAKDKAPENSAKNVNMDK